MARKQVRKGPSTKPQPIRILHLSDFHLSAERRWDADPVLAGLTETIRKEVTPRLAPDVVAITGDISAKGRPQDYKEVRRWIDDGLRKALPPRFPRSRILVVPGNHDVERPTVNRTVRALQSNLLDGTDQDAIAEVLDDSGQRTILLKRHRAYLQFANGLRSAKDKLNVPWWSTTLKFGEQRVHFAGLCSS